ncbi:hypothetical protein [Marivita sp.]|uniref:hypothetical protein n=1 Tax=Marivita sp. TaxID=2003365 RepID=UPI003F6EFE4C
MTDPTDRPGPPTVFHERRTYRRRRIMDAARVAPVLALLLWSLPLVWPQIGEGTVGSATALIYIFSVWAGIILLTWGLSRLLGGKADDPPDTDA